MSAIISSEEDLFNLATVYNLIYGSDIRLRPVSNKPYLGLAIENGDFDVAGIVEGNRFDDAISITIQRYLVELFTPLSSDGLIGSNFQVFTKSLDGVPLDRRIDILRAELLLTAQKLPQISRILGINHRIYDGNNLTFEVNFELLTGEVSSFQLNGVIT